MEKPFEKMEQFLKDIGKIIYKMDKEKKYGLMEALIWVIQIISHLIKIIINNKGEYSNGMRNGKGIYLMSNGSKYEGDWFNN